jgi:protein required for attachment to host cells
MELVMAADVETLIVVADGGRCRGFVEHRRFGPLHELADWAREAPEEERHAAGQSGGSTVSPGAGRSNVHDAPPADAAEARFLEGLCRDIDAAVARGRFARLVLIAPPRSLGLLRAALGAQAARRLEASDPHDRLSETPEQIRLRLREVRVPA